MPTGEERRVTRATMKIQVLPYASASPSHQRKYKKAKEKDKKAAKCKKGTCHACDLVSSLYEVQDVIAHAMNMTVRLAWRKDSQIVDDFVLQHHRMPKAKEGLKWSKDNYYQLARQAHPSVAAVIIGAATNAARNKWRQVRSSSLIKHKESPPHYKDQNTPIPIPAQDFFVRPTENPNHFHLMLSLHSVNARVRKGVGKEFEVTLLARDPRQRAILHQLVEGKNCKVGSAQLQRDRRNRWFVRIAYTRSVPIVAETDAAAINRGLIWFLMLVSDDDADGYHQEEGKSIEQHLRNNQARRRSIQRAWALSGRKGRGRIRALRPAEVLRGKSARWRDTKNQTMAREAINWCIKRGKTVLYIEDFKGIRDGKVELLEGGYTVWKRIQEWRFFDLQTRLISCAEEAGMHVYEVPCHQISKTCPACGFVDLKRKLSRMFTCPSCGYKRHTDFAAARVLLKRGVKLRAEGKLKRKTSLPAGD